MKVEYKHFWVFRVLIDFVNRLCGGNSAWTISIITAPSVSNSSKYLRESSPEFDNCGYWRLLEMPSKTSTVQCNKHSKWPPTLKIYSERKANEAIKNPCYYMYKCNQSITGFEISNDKYGRSTVILITCNLIIVNDSFNDSPFKFLICGTLMTSTLLSLVVPHCHELYSWWQTLRSFRPG